MPKYKVLRVTFQEDFIIEMNDDKISKINGWTIDEIIEDWFKNNNIDAYHATREAYRVGNSRKYITSEVVEG